MPDSAPANSIPQRGSWQGYFSGNPGRVTLVNTVNANDWVLGWIWWLAQYCEKPNIKINTSAPSAAKNCLFSSPFNVGQVDDATTQFWGPLRNTDATQELTWASFCAPGAVCAHANITRQFAELSYWFPAVTFAEGAGGLNYNSDSPPPPPVTNTVTTFDFSPYAPARATTDFMGAPTHSYLVIQPYSIASPAWDQIRNSLCPTYPACN